MKTELFKECRDKKIIHGNVQALLQIVHERCMHLPDEELTCYIMQDRFGNLEVYGTHGVKNNWMLGTIYMDKATAEYIIDLIKG